MITGLTTIMGVSICGACFFLGVFFERVQWNKLIQEGRLPKPRGR
jgi:hypothetical protein